MLLAPDGFCTITFPAPVAGVCPEPVRRASEPGDSAWQPRLYPAPGPPAPAEIPDLQRSGKSTWRSVPPEVPRFRHPRPRNRDRLPCLPASRSPRRPRFQPCRRRRLEPAANQRFPRPSAALQQGHATNRHFPPIIRTIDLVFQNQRLEVKVLVLDLPAHPGNAASPPVRFQYDGWGDSIHHNFHAWLDRLVHRRRILVFHGQRTGREPELAVVRGAEREFPKVRRGLALGLPVVAGVFRNPELNFLERARPSASM